MNAFTSLFSGTPGSLSMTRALAAFIVVFVVVTWALKNIAADAWVPMDVSTGGVLLGSLAALVGKTALPGKTKEETNAKVEQPVRVGVHGADPDPGPGGV